MPRVYRVMAAEDGRPLIGRHATALGVRSSGKSDHFVWRMGEGPFILAPVAVGLQLRPDPHAGDIKHGVIEPSGRMKLEDYEQALAATRNEWMVEEP